jgi:transcriptional regulator with XRE-family HTH domain
VKAFLRGDQYDPTKDLKFLIYNAGFVDRYNDTPAADRREIRRGIPALPFCHAWLTARRRSLFPYDKNLLTLGDDLIKKRYSLRQHQKHVANLLKFIEATVYNWEKNHTTPSIYHIPRVIEFLGYNPYTTNETFGGRIIQARRALGMLQKELSGKLGVDPTTLEYWERGRGSLPKIWKKK